MIDALLLTALGMAIVFLVLFLISYMIEGFSFVLGGKSKPATVVAEAPNTTVNNNEEEIVAAIMAAVTLCMGGTNFKVNSITPLVVRPLVTSQNPSPWSLAGIAENNRR